MSWMKSSLKWSEGRLLLHSFTFNGLNSRDYCGLYVSGGDTFNAPERDIESVSVPGRNGELTIDHGRFKNISVKYNGWINCKTELELSTAVRKLRSWLTTATGYHKLIDDYNPDEYRKARVVNGLTISPINGYTAVQTTIEFDCMPQRFLVSGDDPIEFPVPDSTYFAAPVYFSSLPLIKVDGTGSGIVTISPYRRSETEKTYRLTISDIGGTIYLDSEIARAYTMSGEVKVPADDKVTLPNGYPILIGDRIDEYDDSIIIERGSFVSFSGGVTKVTITPRWWRI